MNKYLAEAQQLMQAHRFLDAAALCKKAMRKPQDYVQAKKLLADCYYNQGVSDIYRSGLLQDAEQHFLQALELNPGNGDALNNLAAILGQQQRFEEAIRWYQKLLVIEPRRIMAYRDLAIAYQQLDDLEAAATVLKKLAALMPEDGSAQLREALLVSSVMPDAHYAVSIRERINQRLGEFEATGKPIANPAWFLGTYFYLSYHGLSNKDLHQRIAAAHLQVSPALAWQAPEVAQWARPQGRIRIGLASSFFLNHSIGHTSRGLVEKLDRARFEVVLIRLGHTPADDVSRAMDSAADRVVEVSLDNLQTAREQTAGLKLDILFWQDIGMDPYSYLLAFARLAPVQLTSFGHPDTTGIPNVDYFLSSTLYETPDSQAHYTETLVCLQGLGTLAYYHRPEAPSGIAARDQFGLKNEDHIYLCPQTLYKIHPDMDDIFLKILAGDARARIVLMGSTKNRMQTLLAKRLADKSEVLSERITFIERMAHRDYLQLIQCADVILDTVHFNGQNTSLEAFALGVPIVTLPGALHRSRHTFGMYQAMGFTDLVAKDHADYADKAISVASNADFAQSCRAAITARAHVLYQNADFIAQCEQAFLSMLDSAEQARLPT